MISKTSCIHSRSNRKRGKVRHLHVQTACMTVIFKMLGLTRFTVANSKAFTCKLRDNKTHSKGLISDYMIDPGWLALPRCRHCYIEIGNRVHE